MASPGNQHRADCIGTLSFPILTAELGGDNVRNLLSRPTADNRFKTHD